MEPPSGDGEAGEASGMEPPSGDGEAGGPDAGWEVSNEAGTPAPGESVEDTPDESGLPDGGESQVDALTRALGELDGEILDERISATETGPQTVGSEAQGSAVPSPPLAEPQIARVPTPIPVDQPDARDDDVVARQIREAAMAATDPELREKLWEEYRRYKSGR